jgi:hypothetical protein
MPCPTTATFSKPRSRKERSKGKHPSMMPPTLSHPPLNHALRSRPFASCTPPASQLSLSLSSRAPHSLRVASAGVIRSDRADQIVHLHCSVSGLHPHPRGRSGMHQASSHPPTFQSLSGLERGFAPASAGRPPARCSGPQKRGPTRHQRKGKGGQQCGEGKAAAEIITPVRRGRGDGHDRLASKSDQTKRCAAGQPPCGILLEGRPTGRLTMVGKEGASVVRDPSSREEGSTVATIGSARRHPKHGCGLGMLYVPRSPRFREPHMI